MSTIDTTDVCISIRTGTVARARSASSASFHHDGAAVRYQQDRYVAVPGDRSPAVRRPVRRLRPDAEPLSAGIRRSPRAPETLGRARRNTVVLLVSSCTMVMAVLAAQTNQAQEDCAMYLIMTIVLRLHLPGRQVRRVLAQVRRRPAARRSIYSHQRRSDRRQPRLRHVLQFLFHDDRPARNPRSGRHRAC